MSSLEQLAHIIAQSDRGPRGTHILDVTERDDYENIILLCPNCHSLIDKNPTHFSVDLLYEWKAKHEMLIERAFVVPLFNTRDELATEVHKLLRENKAVFKQYGPYSESSTDPLSDAAEVWHRRVLSTVLPNNRKVGEMLIANEHLLNDGEKAVLDQYLLHQEAFEYNHVSGEKTTAAPLFPLAMNSLLKD